MTDLVIGIGLVLLVLWGAFYAMKRGDELGRQFAQEWREANSKAQRSEASNQKEKS